MMAMMYVMVILNDHNDIWMTILIDDGVNRIFMMINDAHDNAVKIKKCGKSLLAGQNLGALQCSDLHCAQLHLSGGSAWTQCFVMTQWQKQSQPYTIESPFSTSNWMWNNKRVSFFDVHLLHDHLVKDKCGYLCKVLKNGTCKFYNVNDVRHFNVPFVHYVDDLLFILPAWPPG